MSSREAVVAVFLLCVAGLLLVVVYQICFPLTAFLLAALLGAGSLGFAIYWLEACLMLDSAEAAIRTYREMLDEARSREQRFYAERAELQRQLDAVRNALVGGVK